MAQTYLIIEKTDSDNSLFTKIEAKTVFSRSLEQTNTNPVAMESDVEVNTSSSGQGLTLHHIKSFDSPLMIHQKGSYKDLEDQAVAFAVHFVQDGVRMAGPSGHYAMTVQQRDGFTKKLSLITDVKVFEGADIALIDVTFAIDADYKLQDCIVTN